VDDDGARAALRAPATAVLWLGLIGLAHAQPAAADDVPWADAARPVLRRWHRRARRLARDWPALDEASRHRLRKQLKRLRYLLEFCAPLWPRKAVRRQLAALRPLQDTLGHWNDLAVARADLASQAAQAAPDPAALFAAGWLAREAQACDAECAASAEAWRALKPPRTARAGQRSRR
jgi:CHAD domain-containing protein